LIENPKFATEWTQAPLRELTIKKNFKFSTSEFTRIRHFRLKKICPLPDSSPSGERNIPPHTPHTLPPSALCPPNFELALMPLAVFTGYV